MDLMERLKKDEVLISDGAMGTQLMERGLGFGQCPELWNLTHGDIVLEISKAYVEAGSEMIQTNTFGGNPLRLRKYGLDDRTEEINRKAVEIAREAAGPEVFVVGSVGPTGQFLKPLGPLSQEEVYEAFRKQIMALKKGGVDAICIETMTDLREAILSVKAARENTDLPVMATMTFNKRAKGYYTIMGVSIKDAVEGLIQAGADVVGSNCGNGTSEMIEITKHMRSFTDRFILVHANAGLPTIKEGRTVYEESPQYMAEKSIELWKAGANIIGGCCGTTPAHIGAIAQTLKSLNKRS